MILQMARALIADPAHWTQGPSARDAQGKPVHWSAWNAVAWCLTGAICKVGLEAYPSPTMAALNAVLVERGEEPSPAKFNDSHSHAEVLALVDEAIRAGGVQ